MMSQAGCGPGESSESVVRTDNNDPRMIEAAAEAQRRWPEFVAAFKNRAPMTAYAVKTGFAVKSTDGKEFIWLQVKKIDGDQVEGVIDNEPNNDIGHKFGDTVTIKTADITDWIIAKGRDSMIGGFQSKVLQEIQRERGIR
ncbi:MAG: DUF2314 domain-containing protein [Phycisphaerales bacterium]|nr:DUF2314 domain-containing protein [Phycisphaerales bacterium]